MTLPLDQAQIKPLGGRRRRISTTFETQPGGVDTISGAGAQTPLVIDLRPASLTGPDAGGHVSWIDGIRGDVTIANGVIIENAIGGAASHVLLGNGADNILHGRGGDDTLSGQDGTDIARLDAPQSEFTLSVSRDGLVLTHRPGTEGSDRLESIETLAFSSGTMDLGALTGARTLGADALAALAELYVAYFDRAPGAIGLNYWGTRLEDGMSMGQIAKSFFVQPETQARYPDPDNTEGFVRAVYDDLLGRAPAQEGLAYWTE